MSNQLNIVGDSLARAMARAEELHTASPRRVRVKIVTQFCDLDPGVIVVARIAARSGAELEAQDGKGVRSISFHELDGRARELEALVEEAAAEVEAAVRDAPARSPGPRLADLGLDVVGRQRLIDESQRVMLETATPIIETARNLPSSVALDALITGALRVAALAAIGANFDLSDLVDTLKFEFGSACNRAAANQQRPAAVH
ncbi:MAG: hypothetical protein J0I28_07005 [Caulobacterales bacterium]|nr:hypothetical protein [Caulobacterales bacterium]